jgi:hypothetical protein
MLDPPEHLAVRLASDGHPEPIHIEDTETTFAVASTGQYRIVGPAFLYTDRDSGRATTIFGYPTRKLARMGDRRELGPQRVPASESRSKRAAVAILCRIALIHGQQQRPAHAVHLRFNASFLCCFYQFGRFSEPIEPFLGLQRPTTRLGPKALDRFIADARCSRLPSMQLFARTLTRDSEAVKHAIEEPWSSGQAESNS